MLWLRSLDGSIIMDDCSRCNRPGIGADLKVLLAVRWLSMVLIPWPRWYAPPRRSKRRIGNADSAVWLAITSSTRVFAGS
jgi:hypothetical protein